MRTRPAAKGNARLGRQQTMLRGLVVYFEQVQLVNTLAEQSLVDNHSGTHTDI